MVSVKCSIQECFTLTLPGPTSGVHCANNETSRFSNIQREGEQGVNLLPAFNNLETPPSPILSEKVNKGSISYQRSITLKTPPPSPILSEMSYFLTPFQCLTSFIFFFQIIAAPFAAGALFLKPPWAFISLIPSNIIGEMWVGVTLTVVVELVPNTIRSPAVAGYLFIISIIGGNVPLLVPPLKEITSLRTALYILYPGLYLLSSVFFLLTLSSLKRDMRRAKEEEEVIKPLLPETSTEHGGKIL